MIDARRAARHPDAAAADRDGDRPVGWSAARAGPHSACRSPGSPCPSSAAFVLGELLPDAMLPDPEQRLITSLFLGTALSISSVKIVAMVVREMGFMRRNVGQVIVAAAIIDDTIGWIIIAIMFGLALHGGVDLASLAQSLLGTAIFLVAQLYDRPPPGVPPDPLGQRQVRQRSAGHHRDPGRHGHDGADHQRDRRAHRARRVRRGHPRRPVADPDAPHRRAAARPHRRAVHAGVLRAGRA